MVVLCGDDIVDGGIERILSVAMEYLYGRQVQHVVLPEGRVNGLAGFHSYRPELFGFLFGEALAEVALAQ